MEQLWDDRDCKHRGGQDSDPDPENEDQIGGEEGSKPNTDIRGKFAMHSVYKANAEYHLS